MPPPSPNLAAPNLAAPDGFTGYLLRRAHMIFVQHWQLRFRAAPVAVSPVQGGILVILAGRQDMTQAMLARQLGVEAPTVQQANSPTSAGRRWAPSIASGKSARTICWPR
jgi:hypothetical protein